MKRAVNDLAAVLAVPGVFVPIEVIVEPGVRAKAAAAHGARILGLVEFIFVAEHRDVNCRGAGQPAALSFALRAFACGR
jgi:hypothetical protein